MNGYVRIGTELDTTQFDAQVDYIENQLKEIEYQLKQADMGFEVGDTTKLEAQYEKLSNQLTKIKTQQLEATKLDFSKVSSSIDKTGDSIGKVIKKVGRWVLAIFAIESAYGMVRRAMNTLSNTNEKIGVSVQYIQFALATAMQPIVEWLINAAYQILGLINAISIKMFGFNLFANASADAFSKANKSAKDLKKTTAGFDEMNVLGGNTGQTGKVAPPIDLSSMEVEIPGWLQFLLGNGSQVIAIISGIGGAIIALKLGAFAKDLGLVANNFTAIQATGIGLIIAGLVLAFQGIVAFIKDPSWNNFLTILQGIALIVAGIAILMGGWVVALIAIGVAIVAFLIQNFEGLRKVIGDVATWFWEKLIKPVMDMMGKFGNFIGSTFSKAIEGILKLFSFGGKIFDGMKEGIANVFKTVINGLITGINFIVGTPFKAINTLLNSIRKTSFLGVSPFKGLWAENPLPVPKINYLKTGGIINNPGHGVPLGMNARGGEAGREGVIPLTDAQAMQELGSAIGRYITINANITNTMNGRILSKELKQISNNTDFAMNR